MHADITYENQEGRVRTVFYDGVLRAIYSAQFSNQVVLSLKDDYSIRSYKKKITYLLYLMYTCTIMLLIGIYLSFKSLNN